MGDHAGYLASLLTDFLTTACQLFILPAGWLAGGLISVIPSAVTIDNIDTAPCQLT